MARLVFGMNQSLDGYVDHLKFAPSPSLFRHFVKEAQSQAGSIYGRKVYELMAYWDDDRPENGMVTGMRSRRRGGASPNGSSHAR